MLNKKFYSIFFALILVLGTYAWYTTSLAATTSQIISSIPTPQAVSKRIRWKPQEIQIAFVGDIMLHGKQIKSAYNSNSKTYGFSSYFKKLQTDFIEFDYLVGNLETPVAGKELGYGAYPLFNAPNEILTNLKDSGFDMLQLANNHTYDRGYTGMKKTLENVKSQDFEQVGYAPNITSPDPAIISFEDMKVAFIAGTYGFNTAGNPKNVTDGVVVISEKNITEMIKKSQELGADVIIVLPHWGTEYSKIESEKQVQQATKWIEEGAHLVVGSHPHVTQPVREITTTSGKKGVVAYSLGNFVSNQQDPYTDLGGIFTVSIRKDTYKEPARINNYEFKYLFNYQNTTRRPGFTDYSIDYLENAFLIPGLTKVQKARISEYMKL